MADFKKIITAYPDAASNTSLTSAFTVPGEFSHFAINVPAMSVWAATIACGNVRVLGSPTLTGTYVPVGYSNNPATTTSGFAVWESGMTACISGGIVICEALQFVPYAKLQFTGTMTAATSPFIVFGRKFD